jgi:hypothetical protein
VSTTGALTLKIPGFAPPQGVLNLTTDSMTNICDPKQHQLNGVGSKGALLFCVVGTALVMSMNSLLQCVSNLRLSKLLKHEM